MAAAVARWAGPDRHRRPAGGRWRAGVLAFLLIASCRENDPPATGSGTIGSAPSGPGDTQASDAVDLAGSPAGEIAPTTIHAAPGGGAPVVDFAVHAVELCTDPATAPDGALPYPSAALACVVGEPLAGADVIEPGSVAYSPGEAGGWAVSFGWTEPDGNQWFGELASACVERRPPCESQQLALVFDGTILAAPSVVATGPPGEVRIEGNFTEAEARDIALMLRVAVG